LAKLPGPIAADGTAFRLRDGRPIEYGREARKRGMRRLQGFVMHENVPMLKSLGSQGRDIVRRATAEHVAFE
jgi:hypothetical protein